jgi:Na+/melibiose symporter-like transporter
MARPLVSDELWELIEPLIPKVARRYRYPGRKRIDDRKVLSGILFVLKTGIGWEHLPQMLSLRLLRIRAFAAGNAAAFFSMASISAGAFLITQYFQFALGYSPLETGVRLLPFFGTPMVVAPLAGRFSGRLGLRPVIAVGLAMLGGGFICVALTASVHPSYAVLVTALAIAGIGVSMSIPTVPAACGVR